MPPRSECFETTPVCCKPATHPCPLQRVAERLRLGLVALTAAAGLMGFGGSARTGAFDGVVGPATTVYVDAAYTGSKATPVTWPSNNGTGLHHLGYDAFATIQEAINQVAAGGTVKVAAGIYVEAQNVTVDKALTLEGPNAGKAGADASRGPEAIVKPGINDADYTPIISVVASHVVVDGFLLDGSNPSLGEYYHADGVTVNAAAAVQNGIYGSPVDVDHITIQNNILTNFSYDGILLELTLGQPNGWNYILNNKFANMWEGLQTYALHSVISNNTFVSVNRGLSLHGTITPAPDGFTPGVVSNVLSIAEWFPLESENPVVHAPGIWINYRREQAAPLPVVGNVIDTPAAPPAGKAIVGLYALNVDGQGSVQFINNVVNGAGNCTYGLFAAQCPSQNAVQLWGGALNHIAGAGVLLDTVDFDWGPGDALVTVSNVVIALNPGATGVRAFQEASTPSLKAVATVLGNTTIRGGAAGVQVEGPWAGAAILNNGGSITGNVVGVEVDSGKALIAQSDLTGNTEAGIRVENGALVDVGDCGTDVTGLGGSPGGSNLSGYGFDNTAPWALENLNPVATPAVLAQHNDFGAGIGDTIKAAFRDPNHAVAYSQSPAVIGAPPAASMVSGAEVPAGATNLADFIAQGGYFSASAATVSFSDRTNPVGSRTIERTYTLGDACGVTSTATQHITIVVFDPPAIATQPQSRTNNAMTTASFSVTVAANSTPPFSYQWFRNGTNLLVDGGNILGATSNVLTVTEVLAADRGQYSVQVSNVVATITSSNAWLAVVDPYITVQPLSVTNRLGGAVSFAVRAVGTAPLVYQWQQNGSPVPGATGSAYSIGSIRDSDAGSYQVTVNNSAGGAASVLVTLTVTHPPVIVTQPADQVAIVGRSVSFSVDVDGQVPFSYQWQKDGVDIPGATARTYTLQTVSLADGARYRVVVTNPFGSQTSQNASLSVDEQPYLSVAGYSVGSVTVFVLRVQGEACVLEASADLGSWTPVATNTAPFSFTDTSGPVSGRRFYRAHTVQ